MTVTIGSLFAGYEGIGLALRDVFDAEPIWFSEFDKAPSAILAHHYPNVPNLGDITKIDWSTVTRPDIMTGGSPCQDMSHAGKRMGMKAGTRSGLWSNMLDAITALRPELVVWENVRGALSAEADSQLEPCSGCVGGADDGPVLRALGRVLGDLAGIGYDAAWTGLRAADVGAPHGRFRVFVLAWPAAADASGARLREHAGEPPEKEARPSGRDVAASARRLRATGDRWETSRRLNLLPTPTVSDTNGAGVHGDGGLDLRTAISLLPTPTTQPTTGNGHARNLGGEIRMLPTPRATDGTKGGPNQRGSSGDLMLPSAVIHLLPTPTATDSRASGGAVGSSDVTLTDATERGDTRGIDFGQYGAAIERWEAVTRPAPSPTEATGKGGAQRLSPAFVEWMMGLPEGWVTDVAISRNDMLKALGNGVVPQQCAAAVRYLLGVRANTA